MSLTSRIWNLLRRRRVDADIDEEIRSHLAEAEAEGRDAAEASRAFGSRLRTREAVHDAIVATRLESLVNDAVFGWRQLLKNRIASAAAILSLALGIGASMAAFQLIDAFFLRPLPVASPQQLHVLVYDSLFEGRVSTSDGFDYPAFQRLRAAVADQAELMAVGYPGRIDVAFGSDQDTARVWRQYVSGWMFRELGLKPALGRLLDESDERTPGAQPYAVISYEFWSRHFQNDPAVVGRRLLIGANVLEIVGVAPEGFTGTDPGTFTDLFLPTTMDVPAVSGARGGYCRIWTRVRPAAGIDRLRERLSGSLHVYRTEQVKTWAPERRREEADYFVAAPVRLESAAAGWSGAQGHYRRVLTLFAVLVGVVLLIACVNVANLMAARTAARAREMALRVSIGAGRSRLVQLVLVESAILALIASASGLVFSLWAAPFVLDRLYQSNQPVRLVLTMDWRIAAAACALTCAVTLAFGAAPAFRASSIAPVSALKGGNDRAGRRRLMNVLVAAQVAFCVLVLFVAGLFLATFERMANQPTGFSSGRLLTIESASRERLSTERWYEAAEVIRALPGVDSAALSQYALMSFNAQTRYVWANGHVPDGTWTNSTWFLGVSPGWFDTMGLALLQGRDFRSDDEYPNVAIVNETFARRYFARENPIGRTFEIRDTDSPNAPGGERGPRVTVRIIGLAHDARYEDMRLPIPATAYVPFRAVARGEEKKEVRATFVVRTRASDPMTLASQLERDIQKRRPEIHVDRIVSQRALVESQMTLERLLATLSLFFAVVALILAAVGLYGVLHYAVLQRRREIGIRMAIGAPAGRIVQLVTVELLAMVLAGSIAGVAIGIASVRYIETFLYHVRPTDAGVIALPLLVIFSAALLAALPPVVRAVRIDPARVLHAE